jgi:acyl-CoA reductase-like NAD-dependent aldehyde dehydrogenase
MAIKRVYVHESIYTHFRDALVAYTRNLKVGPGVEHDTYIGPLQNATQYDKVQSFFDEITKEGQHPVLGGTNSKGGKGYFINPTIIDNPPNNSRIVQEEPFGPIIPLLKWTDEEEVIARANDTKFGLGASVWSPDLQRAERMARQLEAGSVWVNMHFEVQAHVPYGGHKWSGLGTEWGVAGLKQWCNSQSVWVPKKT